MTLIFIALGILVGILLAGALPWALLRKLDSGDRDQAAPAKKSTDQKPTDVQEP